MNSITNKIFISGGGGAEDSFLLDKRFIDSLLKRKILYIPVAMERDSMGFEACYDWIVSALSQHSNDFIDIIMIVDLKDIKNLNINDFDGIYIGGGNTYKLLQHIYDNNFDDALVSFLKDVGTIYGGSAGAIVLGKNIATVSGENDKNYKYNEGLSLIGDYSVVCHYNKNDDKKILEFIELYRYPVIALSEKSGLIIDNNKSEVVGKEDILIFSSDGEKKNIKPGDIIDFVYLTV